MTRREVAELVVRMAVENPTGGYTRIRGALSNLGHAIAWRTVKRILHDHGIEPARSAHLGRSQTVPRLFRDQLAEPPRGHRGIHPQPGGWMEQMARNLTDPVDGV